MGSSQVLVLWRRLCVQQKLPTFWVFFDAQEIWRNKRCPGPMRVDCHLLAMLDAVACGGHMTEFQLLAPAPASHMLLGNIHGLVASQHRHVALRDQPLMLCQTPVAKASG